MKSLCASLLLLALAPLALAQDAGEAGWIDLFNGKDLTGWTPKFAKHELGPPRTRPNGA